MIIEVLGTGNAFSHELGNTSFLVWEDDFSSAVLFECGHTVFYTLRDLENKRNEDVISKIDSVFVSHLHDDHCGSLGTLLEYRYWVLGKKTKVTAPVSFWEIFAGRMDWRNANHIYDGEDERIHKVYTKHAKDFSSCGAIYRGLAYSGDSAQSLLPVFQLANVNLIVHEVTLVESDVHTHFNNLKNIMDSKVKKKTYGIHYGSHEKSELSELMLKEGFGGLLIPFEQVKIPEYE